MTNNGHRAPEADEAVSAAEEVVRALLSVAVHPVWREAIAATRELKEVRAEIASLEARRIAAYEDRTKLLREDVLPKLVPTAVAFLGVLVAYLAFQLGVPVPTP